MRAVFALVLGACSYAPSPASSSGDGAIDVGDDAGDSQMAGCGADGTRACVDATHAGHCQSGVVVADRDCPPSSQCVMGRCAPPAGARPCSFDGDCAGTQVCNVYVQGNLFDGFCTDPIGANTAACSTAGADPTCASGLCATGGGSTFCLRPCSSQNECHDQGIQKCVGTSAPATIEGLPTGTLKHCAP